jgi:uncharacterized protein YndB with AHSA1/START domain
MTSTDTVKVTTPTDTDVVVTRQFDAPRAMVFDALTQPDLLRRWYGPEGWSLDVCDIDLKVGGKWRFVVRRPDGKAIGQKGVYQEVVRPERIVHTESWEDWDPGETLVTVVLTEEGGKTTLTTNMRFPSREVRDVIVKNGLDKNLNQTYDKLDEILRASGSGAA